MCPHHKVGRVKPTYIAACPTKPGWLCSPFSGAVWNNTYSFSSAQHSSLQAINSLSVQLLTPCCVAANDPKNITKNIYIPLHLLLHYFLSSCSLSLPAQKFAERECLPPVEKNQARDVEIREFPKVGMYGVCTFPSFSQLWEVPFQTLPSEGISRCISWYFVVSYKCEVILIWWHYVSICFCFLRISEHFGWFLLNHYRYSEHSEIPST